MEENKFVCESNIGFNFGTLEVNEKEINFTSKKKNHTFKFYELKSAKKNMGCVELQTINNKIFSFALPKDKIEEIVAYIQAKINEHRKENVNDNDTSTVKNKVEPQKSSTAGGIMAFLIIIVICYFGYSLFTSPSTDETDNNENEIYIIEQAIYQIENLLYNAKEKYLVIYNSYKLGKMLTVDCDSDKTEVDDYGRVLLYCSYTYNPQNGSGATMTTLEYTGALYVMYLEDEDSKFYYKLTSTPLSDTFKDDKCWNQSLDKALTCD